MSPPPRSVARAGTVTAGSDQTGSTESATWACVGYLPDLARLTGTRRMPTSTRRGRRRKLGRMGDEPPQQQQQQCWCCAAELQLQQHQQSNKQSPRGRGETTNRRSEEQGEIIPSGTNVSKCASALSLNNCCTTTTTTTTRRCHGGTTATTTTMTSKPARYAATVPTPRQQSTAQRITAPANEDKNHT